MKYNSNPNIYYTNFFHNNDLSKTNIDNLINISEYKSIKNNYNTYNNLKNKKLLSQKNKNNALSFDIINNQKENINLNNISSEYDMYIMNLKEQLSHIKEERIKTENKANIIRHRLTILKNKEKNNFIQFQNIKNRLKIILNKRKESNKKLKRSIPKSKSDKRIINTNYNYYYNNKSYRKLKKTKSSNYFPSTPKLIYSRLYNNYDFCSAPYLSLNYLTNNNINKSHNKYNVNIRTEENKVNNLREKLLKELKKDQEQKRKIEEEIAKIEQEQLNLFNDFKLNKFI